MENQKRKRRQTSKHVQTMENDTNEYMETDKTIAQRQTENLKKAHPQK